MTSVHLDIAIYGNTAKTITNTSGIFDADCMQNLYCKKINPIPPEEY